VSDGAKVTLEDGNYYAECPHCKDKHRLGMWAVAHFSACDIQRDCPACGGEVVILRETEVPKGPGNGQG